MHGFNRSVQRLDAGNRCLNMNYVPERTNEIEENKAYQANGSSPEGEMERPTEKDKIRVAGKNNVRISLARPLDQPVKQL